MHIITIPNGMISVNTYVVHLEERTDAVVIDPGGGFNKINRTIEQNGLIPKVVLLTHGHFDHIQSLQAMRERYNVDVYIHTDDADLLTDVKKNLSALLSTVPVTGDPADILLDDKQELDVCGIRFKVIHTPGHSMGGVVYLTDGAAFTGDTLFRLSIGRMDFGAADEALMRQSLKRLKGEIPASYDIYPGHGGKSTFGFELKNNPYLAGLE